MDGLAVHVDHLAARRPGPRWISADRQGTGPNALTQPKGGSAIRVEPDRPHIPSGQ